MSETELKQLCKLAVQHGRHNLTDAEKETIKNAIDSSKTIDDLLAAALATVIADNHKN